MKNYFSKIIGLFVIMSIITGCTKTQPTCTDKVKNGNETGIDCGGDCPVDCDTSSTTTVPTNIVVPCSSQALTNVLTVNGSDISLPYDNCTSSAPYFQVFRSSTSSLTGSSYYVMIDFYGAPSTTDKVYTLTGSTTMPANNNQVRVRVKIAGTHYYPSGTLYLKPLEASNTCYVCNLTVSGYTIRFKVNCV